MTLIHGFAYCTRFAVRRIWPDKTYFIHRPDVRNIYVEKWLARTQMSLVPLKSILSAAIEA